MEEIKRVLLTRRRLLVLALLVLYCVFHFFKPLLSDNAFEQRDGLQPYLENYRDVPLVNIQRQLNKITKDGQDYWALDRYGHLLGNQVEYLIDYPKFLENVQYQAGTMLSVSIFRTDDDSVLKTAEDYARMEGIELTIGVDAAVSHAFWNTNPTDYLLAAYVMVIVFSFMAERKRGLWNLVCASAGGRTKLAVSRLICLLIAALVGAVLFTSIEVVSGWIRFGGFDELDRYVQSIQEFKGFTIPMTIGRFWIFYGFLRFLGAFLVGLVFWFFFEAIPDRRLAAIAFALFAGAEYALFELLPGNYLLDTLNLFMCIHPKELLLSYEVLSPFGLTLGRIESFLVLCGAAALVGIAALLILNKYRKPTGGIGWVTRLTDFWRRHTASIGFHGKLFFHELYKMLVTGRGAVVFLAALLICYSIAESPYLGEDGVVSQSLETYYRQSQGPVTQNSYDYLAKQRDKLEQRKADFAIAQRSYENGAMSSTEYRAIQLQMQNIPEQEQALAQYEQDLQTLSAMKNGYIVPHWVYGELFGIQDNTASTMLTMSFLAVSLICVLYATTESATGMTKARRATVNGRTKALIARYGAGAAFSVVVCVVIWALQILLLKDGYGVLPLLEAPVTCLHYFRDLSENMSIFGYWCLLSGTRTLMMCVWSVALLWATDRLQK